MGERHFNLSVSLESVRVGGGKEASSVRCRVNTFSKCALRFPSVHLQLKAKYTMLVRVIFQVCDFISPQSHATPLCANTPGHILLTDLLQLNHPIAHTLAHELTHNSIHIMHI